jgi:hypothetical protein
MAEAQKFGGGGFRGGGGFGFDALAKLAGVAAKRAA